MMPHDQSWLRLTHSDTCHPRITIRIDKVNIPVDKNVLIIRAPCCQDQSAEKRKFNKDQNKLPETWHKPTIANRRSKIEIKNAVVLNIGRWILDVGCSRVSARWACSSAVRAGDS